MEIEEELILEFPPSSVYVRTNCDEDEIRIKHISLSHDKAATLVWLANHPNDEIVLELQLKVKES